MNEYVPRVGFSPFEIHQNFLLLDGKGLHESTEVKPDSVLLHRVYSLELTHVLQLNIL